MALSQELLKIIACVSMLIDHIGYAFFPKVDILRVLGRLAFPLYCFLLSQGITHTKNPWKYILRFVIILLLAEIPFDLLFFGQLTLEHQNVMFTLLLGLIMGLCICHIPQLPLKILCVIPFAIAAEHLESDYGAYGIFVIALFLFSQYTSHPRLVEFIGLYILGNSFINGQVTILGFRMSYQVLALMAMIPICYYNGKKSTNSPLVNWGLNLFYPLHLAVLLLIKSFI